MGLLGSRPSLPPCGWSVWGSWARGPRPPPVVDQLGAPGLEALAPRVVDQFGAPGLEALAPTMCLVSLGLLGSSPSLPPVVGQFGAPGLEALGPRSFLWLVSWGLLGLRPLPLLWLISWVLLGLRPSPPRVVDQFGAPGLEACVQCSSPFLCSLPFGARRRQVSACSHSASQRHPLSWAHCHLRFRRRPRM